MVQSLNIYNKCCDLFILFLFFNWPLTHLWVIFHTLKSEVMVEHEHLKNY